MKNTIQEELITSSQARQKGAVTMVIVIAVIVVMLGVLGFILWQQLSNKTDSRLQSITTHIATSKTDPTDRDFITLTGYGVKIPQDTTTGTFKATENTDTNGITTYSIYSTTADTVCLQAGSTTPVPIGTVARYLTTSKSSTADPSVTVGQYRYVFTKASTSCTASETSKGVVANQAFVGASNTFTAQFLKLTQA